MLILKRLQKLVIILGLLLASMIYAQPEEQKPLVDIVVFSFDRPMQLEAYLRSLHLYARGTYAVYVLYRASNDNFEQAYQKLKQDYAHVLFVRQTVDEKNGRTLRDAGLLPTTQGFDGQAGRLVRHSYEERRRSASKSNKIKNDFKDLTLKLSFQISRASYIMYAVDDIIVTDFFTINDCIEALEYENAYAVYLRLGKNITQCHAAGHNTDHPLPPFEITKNGFSSWQFSTGILEWKYPNTLDMAIYRKSNIESVIRKLRFKSPNTFEIMWSRVADYGKKGLAYQQSKIVNIPVNKVQRDGNTPHMNLYSTQQLLDMFSQGLRIDIAPLYKINNKAPHMEFVLTFTQENKQEIKKKTVRKLKKRVVSKLEYEKFIKTLSDYTPKKMREIIVIIPSYNNKNYYEGNLDSLRIQKYEHWRAVYVDDKSPDGTGELVKEYIKKHNLEHKIMLVQNTERYGALANLYNAIHACPDNVIIATLDGDDKFAHENVLSQVNKVYDYFDVWMTYGCYVDSSNYKTSFCADYPQEIIQTNSFRKYRWITSHLRTFYAKLFKRIKKEDLMKDGAFFPVAWDLAIMFPMLEMAGERFKFIPEILYIYNNQNPLGDFRKPMKLQNDISAYIRNLTPYDKLTSLA